LVESGSCARARIDAKSFGDLADAFAGVLAFVQGSTDTLPSI
jgi:hypothetical protein